MNHHYNMTQRTILGEDAACFLQNFISCDIQALGAKPLLAAACNQKGRMIANFWIWKVNKGFHLYLPESMAHLLITHLKKYVFRSKVLFKQIEVPLPPLPNREPIWILPATTEQFTPQMIDLQEYGGVSFNKGCYLGQEIIARTEHLGTLKRHLYHLTLEKMTDIHVGDSIKNNHQHTAGIIVAVSHTQISAVLEDRFIKESLQLNDIAITNVVRSYKP